MKKLFIVFPILAFLVFSCSKEDLQNNDELAGNASLKCAGSMVKVFPNGTDDTQSLTDAFALAKAKGKNAVVKLMPGTFHIGMIEIKEFNGTLSGSGKTSTIITNLPDLPTDDTLQNKLPALITFIGGEVTVSDLSVKMSEALSWLGSCEMNMLLFSDFSADFVPANQHIGVNLQNIAVEGALQKDVVMWDGAVVDFPYWSFDGVKFGPDMFKPSMNKLIPRSNIDATISGSEFSNLGRGVYVYGCKSGNFNFGNEGGNTVSGNIQGLVIDENLGLQVKVMHNEFNIPPYNWNGIDVNTMESKTFEYLQKELGTYEFRFNVFNTHLYCNGIGLWDDWRYEHPDNPVWINMIWDHNTFNNLEFQAWIGVTFAMKDVVYSNNKITGDSASHSGWYNGGTYWIPTDDPNYLLSLSENCKIVNNQFMQQKFTISLDWDTQNYLIQGDLRNVTVQDFGMNNVIAGGKHPGHGLSKDCRNRMERIHDLYNKPRGHDRH